MPQRFAMQKIEQRLGRPPDHGRYGSDYPVETLSSFDAGRGPREWRIRHDNPSAAAA